MIRAHKVVLSASRMTTNKDILKYLNGMKEQANKDNDALRRDVNDKLKSLAEKIDTVKNDAKDKEDRNEIKMTGIIARLDLIEKNMIDNKNNCEKDKLERKKQADRTKEFKNSVGLVDKPDVPEEPNREKTWSEIVDESREKEEEKKEREKQKNTKYWSKKIFAKERKSKDTSDEVANAALAREEEAKKKVMKEKEREDLKMKDKIHDEEDWSWSDSDLDWDGTMEKNEMTKKRKIDRYRRKKLLESKVANKAKHMIGLGPIRRASISYFHDIIADFEEAKKMAVDKFLSEYLQLNEDERKDFEILETSIAKNDDDLIYVTFANFESIREIRSRVATIKNEEIKVRNFIPPQYWSRYRFLSSYCADERMKDKNLKTMIRFNDHDIEVLFKNRSTDDHYNIVALKDIEKDTGAIPKFDHAVSWNKRQDRPPKNPPILVTEAVCPPSLRGSNITKHISTSSSSSGQSLPNKRKKLSHQSVENMEVGANNIEILSDKSL